MKLKNLIVMVGTLAGLIGFANIAHASTNGYSNGVNLSNGSNKHTLILICNSLEQSAGADENLNNAYSTYSDDGLKNKCKVYIGNNKIPIGILDFTINPNDKSAVVTQSMLTNSNYSLQLPPMSAKPLKSVNVILN